MVEEKILVVDDNKEVLEKTRHLLAEVGYDVTCCSSGEEALTFLSDNVVDLVLLDINMPKMNGFDVCLRIRQRHPLDDLPIIFLTSREDSDSVTKGFQAGASDFVSKSAVPEILLDFPQRQLCPESSERKHGMAFYFSNHIYYHLLYISTIL